MLAAETNMCKHGRWSWQPCEKCISEFSSTNANVPGESFGPRRAKAKAFVDRVMEDAKKEGITGLVIGASVYSDGHDGWQVQIMGPCLSALAMIGELRDYFQTSIRHSADLPATSQKDI